MESSVENSKLQADSEPLDVSQSKDLSGLQGVNSQATKASSPNDIGGVEPAAGGGADPEQNEGAKENEQKVATGNSYCDYLLLIWDGIGFFQYKYHEIPRTQGAALTWCDKCKSFKWLLVTFIVIVFLSFIVTNEVDLIGQIKSSTYTEVPTQEFNLTISEAAPFHLIETFDSKVLFQAIRSKQEQNSFKNTQVPQHSRQVPEFFSSFTDEDKAWLEEFICGNSDTSLLQREEFPQSATAIGYYSQTKFKFSCQLLPYLDSDSRLYMHHYLDVNSSASITGEVVDSRTPTQITKADGLLQMKERPNFFVWVNHTHDEDLTANINSMALFQFSGGYTADVSSSLEELLRFKTNPNTTFLMQTREYEIGQMAFRNGSILAQPHRQIEEQQEIVTKFLIPTEWKDIVTHSVQYSPNSETDYAGNLTSSPRTLNRNSNINIHIKVSPTEGVDLMSYYDFMEQASYLGGIFAIFGYALSVFTPFFVLRYAFIMAKSLKEKHANQYREGLNKIAASCFAQLQKIKTLAEDQDDWDFLEESVLAQVEEHLKHGLNDAFKDKATLTNEDLHTLLKGIIDTIHTVQKVTVANRNCLYSSEVNKLNCNMKPNLEVQKTLTEITAANSKLAKQIGLKDRLQMFNADMDRSGVTQAGYNEMFEDLDATEVLEFSMIELQEMPSQLKKRPRSNGVSNFHYRRSLHDIAFAMSITDEILNLEPLEDKLEVLRRKHELTLFQVILTLKSRMSFFSLYNLFDAVEYNHNDSQAQIQKLFLHLKKQENEIDLLKRQVSKFEGLQFLAEEGTLKKLKTLINGDCRPSATSVAESKLRQRDSADYVGTEQFTALQEETTYQLQDIKDQLISQQTQIEMIQQYKTANMINQTLNQTIAEEEEAQEEATDYAADDQQDPGVLSVSERMSRLSAHQSAEEKPSKKKRSKSKSKKSRTRDETDDDESLRKRKRSKSKKKKRDYDDDEYETGGFTSPSATSRSKSKTKKKKDKKKSTGENEGGESDLGNDFDELIFQNSVMSKMKSKMKSIKEGFAEEEKAKKKKKKGDEEGKKKKKKHHDND